MRKQVRGYFRKSLCGMLSAAMIATSLIVPNMTVYAAPQDDEVSMTTENGEYKLVDESTGVKEEGEDKDKDSGSENPSGSVDGNNENADDKDSGKGGESDDSSEDGNGSGEESGDIADEEDKENLDSDLTDNEDDEEDEELKSEDEGEAEEYAISLLAETGTYGTLQNGDFETQGDNGWGSAASWTAMGGNEEGDEAERKSNEYATDKDNIFFHFYNKTSAGKISLSQKIENVQPGDYSLSLQVAGEYTEDGTDPISVEVRGTSLAKMSLGAGPGWDRWKTIEAGEFNIPEEGSQVDIEIIISGTLNAGNTGYIDLDNVELTLQDENASTDRKVDFYYYAGDDADEVGLNCSGTNISSMVATAEWKNDTYLMTPVEKNAEANIEGYKGWYSIPLTIANGGADAGFEIYIKPKNAEVSTYAVYKCDGTDDNSDVYTKLASGTEKAYAVKNEQCYDGKENVTAILRNVTLFVYDDEATPALQSGKTELSVIDEDTGEKGSVTSGKTEDKWNNYIYNMSPLGNDNWYQLSFVAPGKQEFDNVKICELYDNYDNKYDYDNKASINWLANFMNGSDSVDFTPVFAGKNYYYKGRFYTAREAAVTQLRELLNSDEFKKIDAKGETGYTAESWEFFSQAKTRAEEIISNYDNEADELTSNEIEKAYEVLRYAMDAMVSLSIDVTFYYYAGDMEEGEEIGLYHWGADLTSTAKNASWTVWGADDTYSMTAVEGYAGWYSVPLSFTNNGKNAGFQIFKKSAALSEKDADKVAEYICEASKGDKEFFGKVTSGDATEYAVKNSKGYAGSMAASIMRQVTLHVYNAENTPYLHMGKAAATFLSVVNEETGELTPLKDPVTVTEEGYETNAYALQQDEEHKNWYSLTFTAPGKFKFDKSEKIFNLYVKDSTDKYAWVKDFMNGAPEAANAGWQDDFTPVFAGKTYYKDGKFYATLEEADPDAIQKPLDKLQELVDEAKKYKKEDYKEKGWKAFTDALAAAEAVIKAADDAKNDETGTKTAPTDDEIQKVYDELEAAMKALIPASTVDADINVQKVALADDFITGADLSSYISLRDSGTVFKDEKGNPLSDAEFFKYLKDGGTNWVRIRIWNDPYDGSGRGYGGGNNDLEKAKTMGKLATDAGMKVLIDFHYSDFWADPSKQQAPKAWKAMSLAEKEAAVESYTLSSLNALRNAGVNVGMVQVGNETNNAICGVTSRADMAKIFNAGSRAVRAFDKNCLVALHFTNPEKGGFQAGWAADLKENKVDYDVFATSYYPFWHGTTGDLEGVLQYIAETYDKKVMVAETSWTTSWDDGDGHENTAPRTSQALNYDISLQGQADEIRDVVNAVNKVNDAAPGKAIGVFYWEPAWISPYYVYDEDGKADEKLVAQNREAWEKYGSGWASSYAKEYDPDDAGKWHGGSAVDNQAWFDFDGTALPTAKVYSLIRTGATAERAISSIGFAKDENPLEVSLGDTIKYPQAVAAYNDGTVERLDVQWDQEEQEAVNTDKVGEYVVHGTVTEGGKEYKLTLTIKVMRTSSANILQDPGFEKGISHPDWDLSGAADCVSSKEKDWIENPRSGTYAMNFWSEDPAEFSVSQTVAPEAGSYTFGAYIQGDGAGTDDVQYAFVEVSGKDGKLKFRRQAAFTLNGWRNWVNPEITGVEVETGDSVKVGVTIKATETGTSGVWGSLDDFYLYGTHSVSIGDGIEHGSVETSVIKANSGEKVIVTVTPDEGYYLDTMTLSGRSITAENCADILTSTNGTVAFRAASGENTTNAAVLTYAAETAEAKSDAFTMPNGNVIVGATFKSIFGELTGKIDLSAKDEAGNYLVQVNAEESNSPAGENPVPAQFHTGKNVTPIVELSYKGYKLTTADYTVAYANNKNITTPENKAKITLTAKGDKFTGTREILFEIKEDTRKEFSEKKLKVVFEASDKNGRTDKAAQAVYYLGKEKEIVPKISLYNVTDAITDTTKAINPALYTVYYQDNKKIGKATLVVLPTDKALNDPNGYKEGSITANFTIAKCPVNQDDVEVTISTAPNYYTGKKVEPSVTVKYNYTDQGGKPKTVTLAKGTDYTVTCTNNVNASVYKTVDENGTVRYELINANKVPTIKITGKGNFVGVRTTVDLQANGKAGTNKLTFQIRPRELSNTTVTAADLAESTKEQAPKITVMDGTKAVAASQYEITEIKRTHDADGNALAADQVETVYSKGGTSAAKVKQSGTYAVKIAGKEKTNYAGDAAVSFCVVDKDYLISNAKITVSGKFYYTGDQVKLTTTGDSPNLKVSCGKAAQLTEQSSASSSQDGYYVRYTNNTNAGRAAITITGTGKYKGSKTATFTINKRTLTDKITKDSDKGLKGTLQTVKISKKTIETKQDGVWTPSTDDSGLLINSDNTTKTEYGSLAIPYTGYTLNPEFRFSSENYDAAQKAVMNELSSSDYTVTYAIGKWTNDGKAPVTATIKGKGNYSGSVKIPNLFTVTARNLKDLRIDVSPVTYNGKALKPAVTFRDDKGKVVDLKLNTAYSISYKNNKDIMGVSKKQPTLTVKVKGKGWITDNADPDTKSRTLNFTIDQAEITKADIEDVKFQKFLGKALKPKVTVKVNGRKLKEGKDYTLTYSKNVKRGGTATVKISGKGNYFTRKPIEKTFVIK